MKISKHHWMIALSIILSVILISACATGSTRSNGYNKDGRDGFYEESSEFDNDYSQNGESYENLKGDSSKNNNYDEIDFNNGKSEKFYQRGIASWYGREFHGKETASGEKFNMYKYTAAHRTLPFGTLLNVKNSQNGKSIKVRINDRGPYKGNRIIDLSYGAAKKLGMVSSGNAQVEISVIKKPVTEKKYSKYDDVDQENIEPVVDESITYNDYRDAAGNYSIQVGAFYSKRNAENHKKRVEEVVNTPVSVIHDGDLYKVRVEGVNDKEKTYYYKRLLQSENIPAYVIEN